MAEDDKDHTIWSSSSESESDSLAHLVLSEVGVGESMSSDDEGDDMEVDMISDVLLIGLMERRGTSSRRSLGLFIIHCHWTRPDRGWSRAAP